MNLFPKVKRYGPCIGLSFSPKGRKKIEIWWAPKKYRIEEHSHPNQDIELTILWGNNVFLRRKALGHVLSDTYFSTMPKSFLKTFSIRAGDTHSFETSSGGFLFLNRETWKPDVEITSASEDFKLL